MIGYNGRLGTLALLAAIALSSLAADEYTLGPDSQRHPGIPRGTVEHYVWDHSKVYPGTTRSYWVYVPAQYKPDKPAPYMVFQDGGGFVKEDGSSRIPIVFDNLIARGELPTLIGIFVDPGVLRPSSDAQQIRYNRSYEYDALGDRYARFLIEEIIPEVAKKYNLSRDASDHAIAGSSSGAIAAFTAAWERPDVFRRVLSFIGSYSDLRGGDIYPALIRKTEPKPIRVFQQDGRNDLNIYAGSWYIMNQSMHMALEWAGYDTNFVVGTEGHNMKQGGAILPDALRWLWRGYPAPIKTAAPKLNPDPTRPNVYTFLDSDSDWQLVGDGYKFAEGPAVDKDGNVYFTDIPTNRIYRADIDGKVSVFKEDSGGANGMMFGPDGRLYVCQNGRRQIVSYGPEGDEKVLAKDVNSNDLAVTAKGDVYFTDPPQGRVWLIKTDGRKRPVWEGKEIAFPNGVRLSPDQSLLYVADTRNKWVWSFRIEADGLLADGEPFYRLETTDESSASGADGMAPDTDGFLYVATKLGIQICDPPGRVNAIINKPQPGPISNVVFGGPDRDWLYVTAGDKVFRRHMQRKGVVAWQILKPATPHL